MKQARAYGVGCVLATQNPMDLDYRALSNAGTWILGRLTTDADRARVVEGLGEDKRKSPLDAVLKKLRPRWFVVRDARGDAPTLLNPRWAMSYLRGPMTSVEIRRARETSARSTSDTSTSPTSATPMSTSPTSATPMSATTSTAPTTVSTTSTSTTSTSPTSTTAKPAEPTSGTYARTSDEQEMTS